MRKLLVLLILSLVAVPVAAQDDCFMYNNDCKVTAIAEYGYENLLATVEAIKQATLGAPATPTPLPIPLPAGQMYEGMATANASINGIPADLGSASGLPLLPAGNTQQLFGYVKWLGSLNNAEEYAGPFAPIFQMLGIFLFLSFVMVSVYGIVYGGTYFLRWAGWLFNWFLRIVDLIMQIIQALGPIAIIVALIGALLLAVLAILSVIAAVAGA